MKDGGSAFPIVETRNNDRMGVTEIGLTIRDYFAAQALAGYCVGDAIVSPFHAAKFAYEVADAMLEEREAKK